MTMAGKSEKDFEIEIRIRNGRIAVGIRRTGLSVLKWCTLYGLSASEVCALMTMRKSPLRKDGAWREFALRVASALGHEPEDLWPDIVLAAHGGVQRIEANYEDLQAIGLLPQAPRTDQFLLAEAAETTKTTIAQAMQSLNPTQAKVLYMRFWEGLTLVEISRRIGRSMVRTRQIQIRAMEKMQCNKEFKAFLLERQQEGKEI